MTNKYLPQSFEKKWIEYWEKNQIYKVDVNGKKQKMYVLDMFPYPSGAGLHVGHPRGYVGSDILARFYRMRGYDVLHPMGWDAFGLPAENAAIKAKRNPAEIVEENIATFKRQLKMLGFSYDWSREFTTTDPNYYKWTQWLFIQFFKMGLLYKKLTPVYYCPFDKTGIAQEEVLPDGTHERCGTPIVTKELPQWIFGITVYAERLLNELEGLNWPQGILEMQKNWIGKSEGAQIIFKLSDSEEKIQVFTTRPDTLFGATALVIAPEHFLVEKILSDVVKVDSETKSKIADYVKQAKSKMDLQRTDLSKDKTGVSTTLHVIHPLTGEKIPVWVADYVLGQYGYGAVMIVPAHDERDHKFVKKYNLPIKEVLQPLYVQTSGHDAVRENMPFTERDAVVAIVKHWSEDKYLCLQWKNVDWRGFIVGGIEKNEDPGETAKREIREETGYKNTRFIKKLGDVIQVKFYHTLKKENRWAHFQGVYLELENGDREEISEKEQSIHEIHWIPAQEVASFINVDDMRLLWHRLQGKEEVYKGEGILINSGEFDGMESWVAREKIIEKLANKKAGRVENQYKIRDWIFSRQRYWGEPIPMIFCKKCAVDTISYWDTEAGKSFQSKHEKVSQVTSELKHSLAGWFPLEENSLPLELPYLKSYEPTETAESPLSKVTNWVNTTCPNCGGQAKRETDTMPNWAGSCWYFLRFTDPHDSAHAWSPEALKKWLPVDMYIGGAEHAVLHLLYSRFWVKALEDLGLVNFNEPFMGLRNQGMILASDHRKMSKSWGNVINPDDVVNEYGADALRTYEMFMAPFNQEIPWSTTAFQGAYRFMKRVWDMYQKKSLGTDEKLVAKLNRSIMKVSRDIVEIKFNTAVSTMMEFLNDWEKSKEGLDQENAIKFLKILAPFAPFLTEEIWQSYLNEKSSIHQSNWPDVDLSLLEEDKVIIPVQVNGKLRTTLEIEKIDTKDTIVEKAKKDKILEQYLINGDFSVIYKDKKVLNFVLGKKTS